MLGVFLCHCGTNIASNVDIQKLREHFSAQGHFVADHLFLCSQAGQDMIKEAVRENSLDRVVIASCSPKHHGGVFKECVGAVLNPYMWDMANIREQCAWVVNSKEEGTKKASALIAGAVRRVSAHEPIATVEVPVVRRAAIIGGGIAGMHAALELAAKGLEIYLIEKQPNLGGNMVRLDRTFPTDDCAMCTISPILNQVMMDPLIKVMTLSQVTEVSGRPGAYHLKVAQRPRFVDYDRCTGCGACATSEIKMQGLRPIEGLVDRISIQAESCKACGACAKKCVHGALTQAGKGVQPKYDTAKCVGCWECLEACKFDALKRINVCPVVVSSEFDLGLGPRKAIYVPGTQAVPLRYLRDPDRCLRLRGEMDCLGCERVCSAEAISDMDFTSERELDVGAIVVATGYRQMDLSGTEYRTEHPNVITGLQLERLLSPAGPTNGKLLRPSDGKPPRSVVFVQCAGSRDRRRKEYCSKICCMYATKNASLIKQDDPEVEVKVAYTDLRAAGRGYEEYFDRAREMGVEFVRNNIVVDVMGSEGVKYLPFIVTVFFAVLFNNFLGLVPGLKPGTGTLGTTFGWGIMVFVVYNWIGFKKSGFIGYMKSFLPSGTPWWLVPLIYPLEIISHFLRPFTLGVRLYANMYAGHIVLGVFGIFVVMVAEAISPVGVVVGSLSLIMQIIMYDRLGLP
ncbi:MAG: F0F1 ATP synthase subunit A [candidate division NC10 bacterium]